MMAGLPGQFHPRTRATLIGCGALVLWASSLPFAKRCAEDVGPLTTVTLQYFVSGVLGLLFYRMTGRFRTFAYFSHWQFYARVFLFGLYFALLYFAIGSVDRSQLPIVTLLNYLWPTFTMLLSVALLAQPARIAILLIGSSIVVAGLAIEICGEQVRELLTGPKDRTTLFALAAALISSFVWGLATVLNRKWGPLAGELQALPFVLLFASFGLMVIRFSIGEHSTFSAGSMLPLTYLCLMPFLANVCWDIGTRLGSITVLSLLADALPWASLTITQVYLGVPITGTTWISAFAIVAGALVSRFSLISAVSNQPK